MGTLKFLGLNDSLRAGKKLRGFSEERVREVFATHKGGHSYKSYKLERRTGKKEHVSNDTWFVYIYHLSCGML